MLTKTGHKQSCKAFTKSDFEIILADRSSLYIATYVVS